MCGADIHAQAVYKGDEGSSPRVRSRRRVAIVVRSVWGIISACAEQTMRHGSHAPARWDHLRVCGADNGAWRAVMLAGGSSPRVRSRHRSKCGHRRRVWIISACAEQTSRAISSSCPVREHLRVCGADLFAFELMEKFLGSSPRVRSRQVPNQSEGADHGIISACAEQTSITSVSRPASWDHLRVCGADPADAGLMVDLEGSSPRVRSRRV